MSPNSDADPKRPLVERAIAAADRARPALERRKTTLPEVAATAAQALAAARAWLDRDDPALAAAAATAATAARKAIGTAWLKWDEGVIKDLLNDKRAINAGEAAMLAAEAAAWTPERARLGWEHDAAEMRARVAAGPVLEAAEAERCAQFALGAAAAS